MKHDGARGQGLAQGLGTAWSIAYTQALRLPASAGGFCCFNQFGRWERAACGRCPIWGNKVELSSSGRPERGWRGQALFVRCLPRAAAPPAPPPRCVKRCLPAARITQGTAGTTGRSSPCCCRLSPPCACMGVQSSRPSMGCRLSPCRQSQKANQARMHSTVHSGMRLSHNT